MRVGMPALLMAAALGALVRATARPLTNPDTYFHLRFGREFLDGWSLRDPGSVSTFATADWVPTQWLPQVVMARVEEHWGLAAVALLGGLLSIAFTLTVYVTARQRADALAAATATVVAVVACWPFLSMRPQVLSYIFAAATVGLWVRARRAARPPWLVLPLTWLWAMCHGMWPVGLSISAVALLAAALERRGKRHVMLDLLVLLGSAAAAAATPVGPSLYGAVLGVTDRADYFSEWGPTEFDSLPALGILALLVPTFLVLMRRSDAAWFDVLLVSLATGWVLYSGRTVPVAAAIGAPIAASTLQRVIGPRHRWGRPELAALGCMPVAAIAALAAITPATSRAPAPQPAWVDPVLGALRPGTAVLNDWDTGGYVMWRYPYLDLVMHGYGDTFTIDELERNRDLLGVEPGWDELARGTGAKHALLRPDSPLAYALVHQTGWQVVHESDDIEFLVAPPGWPDE